MGRKPKASKTSPPSSKPARRMPTKGNQPNQYERFIATARSALRAMHRPLTELLMGRLARTPPEPRAKPAKGVKRTEPNPKDLAETAAAPHKPCLASA